MPRQDTDSSATLGKIGQHLSGDFLRKGRHPFNRDTVIGGKNADPDALQAGCAAALQAGQGYRDLFQAPQGTGRLGELCLSRQRLSQEASIQRYDRLLPPRCCHSFSPFNTCGRPATQNTTRSQVAASA